MIISGQIKNRISSWTQPWVKTPPPKYLLAKSTCNKNVCKSLKHVLFFHWTKKGTRLVYFEACVVFSLNQKRYKAKYKFHKGMIEGHITVRLKQMKVIPVKIINLGQSCNIIGYDIIESHCKQSEVSLMILNFNQYVAWICYKLNDILETVP